MAHQSVHPGHTCSLEEAVTNQEARQPMCTLPSEVVQWAPLGFEGTEAGVLGGRNSIHHWAPSSLLALAKWCGQLPAWSPVWTAASPVTSFLSGMGLVCRLRDGSLGN